MGSSDTFGARLWLRCACLGFALSGLATPVLAAQDQSQQGLEELRDTVVNLLESLVERGVLTREQAQALVKAAQEKAAADAAAQAKKQEEQQKEEANAVRVPYVPQIVKEEIKKEVVSEMAPSMKEEISHQLNTPDNLRGLLPEWVQRMTWTGDVRVRDEGDEFAAGNSPFSYYNYSEINTAGGIVKAGEEAYLNTTDDRNRPRLRLRFGFDDDLGGGWTAGMRVATGAGEIYITTNQTLGTYGQKYQIALDQGYLRWTGQTQSAAQIFSAEAGRLPNPFLGGTDIIWYTDLTFEGIASSYRLNLLPGDPHRFDVFLTGGAFPLTTFTLFDPNQFGGNKWLAAGQLGLDFHTEAGSRYALAAGYYDFLNIVGQRNPPDSTLYNWTAPGLLQKGNTMFDISNTTDPTVNLFALAADYKIAHVTAIGEWDLPGGYMVGVNGDAVRNVGYNTAEVSARVGQYVAPRTRGYLGAVGFGTAKMTKLGDWHASVGYRYVERDAVVDAFNDEDFHLGGTDTKGYTLIFDLAFNPRVFMRLKYMAADEIDGISPCLSMQCPALGIDVWELDFNARL